MNPKYKNIIDLPHHVSEKYPQMSIEDRAAQFAPFAALTGHSEAIKQTSENTNYETIIYTPIDEE